jgi:hypothetical protein
MPYGDFDKKTKFLVGVNRILAEPDRKAEAAAVLSEFVAAWEQGKKQTAPYLSTRRSSVLL